MPKCAWTHCPCNQVIEDMSDAVKDKTRYYHKDCLKQRNTINDIITLFTEQVNDKIVMSQLRNVINTLVFKEGYEAEYVLYAVRYAINHPYMKLTYPAGIRRICLDQNVKSNWDNMSRIDTRISLEGERVYNTRSNKPHKKVTVAELFEN